MPAIGQFQLNQLRDAIDLSNNAIQQSTNAIQHQNAATTGLRSLLTTLLQRIASYKGHTTQRSRQKKETNQRNKMSAQFTNKLMVAVHNPVTQAPAPGPAALVAARDNQIVQAARQVVAEARSTCCIEQPLKALVIMAWVNEDLVVFDSQFFTQAVRQQILA